MFKHLWIIATDTITVLVILAMFGRAETPFQTIMFSALAIIYGAVRNVGAGLAQQNIYATRFNMGEFARLRRLLKDQDLNEMDILETDNTLEKANTYFFIAYAFGFVIWGIAVWNILGVIL